MGMYSTLTDVELAAEIAEYRAARKAILLSDGSGVGAVKRITDGDRTIEYTAANLGSLETELRALLAEDARRKDPYGAGSGRAIEVEFD